MLWEIRSETASSLEEGHGQVAKSGKGIEIKIEDFSLDC